MEVDISLVDFPFVCRICLIRGELRLFEEENCLWDLFLAIAKIDVCSTVNFPRNICNECVNKLKDILWFIEVSKNDPASGKNLIPKTGSIEYPDAVRSGMNRESSENKEDISVQILQFCRICSSSRSLILCEEKSSLMELFRTITNIDVQTYMNCWSKSSICHQCVNELEKISSFIDLLFYNNRKLQNAINRNEAIKTESDSDGNTFDVGLSRCEEMKVDLNEIKVERSDENSCHYESNEISAMIDIKEENFDGELVASVEQNYRNRLELETQSQFEKKIVDSRQHLPVHTEDKPYKCDCCDRRFNRKLNLKRHMLTHTVEKLFECDYCEKRFNQEIRLKEHMLIHTGEKLFKCDYCTKQFIRARSLRQHMFTHTGERPFKCDCCEKTFHVKGSLKVHTLTHMGEKSFECDACEKTFNLKHSLKRHMLTHTGEKPYKCDCCEKSFPLKNSLNLHMLSHTGTNPFKCDCCEKSFPLKTRLNIHLLTHTGEKPFQCDRCTKRFSQMFSLKRHMLTHKVELPFKCDCCRKQYTCKSYLERHMLTHTGEKPSKCD